MAGPLGTRAQRHPVHLIPPQDCGRKRTRLKIHMPSELLKVVLPMLWSITRGWRPLPGMVCPWAGGKDYPDTAQTLQGSHKPLSQAWDGNTDKNTNSPGFHSRQKHVNSTGATVFFSHRTPQRGIDQDVTQEVVFFFFFLFSFLFHGNLSQQHYHLLYFSKENSHQKARGPFGRQG